jgi:hypothetical protein
VDDQQRMERGRHCYDQGLRAFGRGDEAEGRRWLIGAVDELGPLTRSAHGRTKMSGHLGVMLALTALNESRAANNHLNEFLRPGWSPLLADLQAALEAIAGNMRRSRRMEAAQLAEDLALRVRLTISATRPTEGQRSSHPTWPASQQPPPAPAPAAWPAAAPRATGPAPAQPHREAPAPWLSRPASYAPAAQHAALTPAAVVHVQRPVPARQAEVRPHAAAVQTAPRPHPAPAPPAPPAYAPARPAFAPASRPAMPSTGPHQAAWAGRPQALPGIAQRRTADAAPPRGYAVAPPSPQAARATAFAPAPAATPASVRPSGPAWPPAPAQVAAPPRAMPVQQPGPLLLPYAAQVAAESKARALDGLARAAAHSPLSPPSERWMVRGREITWIDPRSWDDDDNDEPTAMEDLSDAFHGVLNRVQRFVGSRSSREPGPRSNQMNYAAPKGSRGR